MKYKILFLLSLVFFLSCQTTQTVTDTVKDKVKAIPDYSQSVTSQEHKEQNEKTEENDEFIADESSVGTEFMARDILNHGETFTPNKIYFVNKKIKKSKIKTLEDSGNIEKQNKSRRKDQAYLLDKLGTYTKQGRFSLICTKIGYGLFGSSASTDADGDKIKEYFLHLFDSKKYIGSLIRAQNSDLGRKCLKFKKHEADAMNTVENPVDTDNQAETKKDKDSVSDWLSQNVL